MKTTTILLFLIVILSPLSNAETPHSDVVNGKSDCSSIKYQYSSNMNIEPDDIADKIIEKGGVLVYSIKLDSIITSYEINGETAWPEEYILCNAAIYHYFMDGVLCFKLYNQKSLNSEEASIITLVVQDIDCTDNKIFSCTYICIDAKTNKTFGIASDLSDNQLDILVNNVTDNSSIAFKTPAEKILKYNEDK